MEYEEPNNMKGTYGGVQNLVTDLEPNVVYVHCAAHKLNLIVNDKVKDSNNL